VRDSARERARETDKGGEKERKGERWRHRGIERESQRVKVRGEGACVSALDRTYDRYDRCK